MKKEELRKKLISKRFLIESHFSKSKKIQDMAIEEIKKVKSKRIPDRLIILSYFSKLPEVVTEKLNAFVHEKNHTLLLPACKDEKLIPLVVINEEEDLIKSKFEIMEPRLSFMNDPSRIVDPSEIDIVIVPGVGFDKYGNRLGYGKGFYDRFLPRCVNAVTIGLCFDEQLLESIPTESHDQKVNMILTDKQIIKI